MVGLVGFEPGPVAAATALPAELIEQIPTFAGFVEAFAMDCFCAGEEFLAVNEVSWRSMFGGEGLAAIVLQQTSFDVLGRTYVSAPRLRAAQHVDIIHARRSGRAGGI